VALLLGGTLADGDAPTDSDAVGDAVPEGVRLREGGGVRVGVALLDA
jgi:hypothetical protein